MMAFGVAVPVGRLAGSDTLVVLNQGDFLRRGGVFVKRVGEPFAGEPAGQFQTDDALAEGEDLGVVAQHGAFHREGVVGGDGPDAGDLVRGDGHAQAGAADQQGAVSLAGGDQFGGGDGHGRVGSVAGGVDADVGHGLDQVGGLQVGLEGFLVFESGVVGSDDQAQFGAHAFSFTVLFAAGVFWAGVFSACGRARPMRGSSWAVSSAACCATEAAEPQASVRDCPASTPAARESRNGTSTSTRVLSPGLALPKSMIAAAACATPAAIAPASGALLSPTASPTARRAMPQRAPEVPPALSAQASAAKCSVVPAPAPRARASVAASTAARTPRS